MRSSPCAPIRTTVVADLDVGVGAELHRHVVHAHRADQRVAAAADQHVAVVREAAPPAVAVADRHRRDPGRLGAPSSGARSRRASPGSKRLTARRPRTRSASAGSSPRAAGVLAGTGPARRSRRRSAPCRSARPGRAARRRCWPRGRPSGRRRPTASTNSRKRLELRGEEVVAGLVGGGEVGHQPDHVRRRARQPQRQLRGPWCRAGPCRCRASRARAARGLRATSLGPGDHVGVARPRPRRSSAPVSAPITRIGASMPVARAARRLVGRGDRQPRGAAGQRRRGDRGAVAVAVGLHDRAQLGAAAARPPARWQLRSIAPRGRLVRERARRCRCRCASMIRARLACRSELRSVRPSGSASITSPAITWSAPTRSAAARTARRVGERAEAGGLERLQPLGEQRADQAGQHVAGAGGGQRGRAARVDGDLAARARDDRVVALQQHDGAAALGRLARATRAGAPRSRRTGRSSRRPSSPACGVSTVGRRALARAARAARRARSGRRRPPAAASRPRRRRRGRTPGRRRSRPRPGPSTTAPARSAISLDDLDPGRACGRRRASGSPRLICSSRRRSTSRLDRGRHGHLHVAGPARCAERAAIVGAPVRPREPPATTSTPGRELRAAAAAARDRGRARARRSARPARRRARPAGRRSRPPRRAPACALPGSTHRPTFGPWKVAVTSARTASASTSPVEASTPEGTSQATTGAS